MIPSSRTIRDTFPHWTLFQCKLYRLAIIDHDNEGEFGESNVEGEDEETECYLKGWADAMGHDAEGMDWFPVIADWRIQYRWWE